DRRKEQEGSSPCDRKGSWLRRPAGGFPLAPPDRQVTSASVIRTLIRRGLRIGVVVGAILFLIQVFRNPASKDTGSRRPSGPAAPPRRPQREAGGRAARGRG